MDIEYMHHSNGRWFPAYVGDYRSLAEYKSKLRKVYGSLRGIKFAVRGIHFDRVDWLMGYPLPVTRRPSSP